MKKLIFTTFLFSIFILKQANAQLSINLNINVGSQPTWGPTGYDHVEYYYLPDIDCYYYVPGQQFVYQNGSQWVWKSSLPPQYNNYDLYNGYKVVVNKPKPYLHNAVYRTKYSSYKGRRDQPMIRDSRDAKYKRSANNGRPTVNKPTPNRPPAKKPSPNRPANNQKPAHSANDHRPASNDHSTPQKSKPDNHRADDKKDDKGHH
jgi:hypothetical protein